jgi:regulatory protein
VGAAPRTLKQRAIAHLARREYPRAELRARLLATGATAAEVDPLLDELAASGFLSDARFAQGVVRQKAGGYARRAIARTLKEKGVGDEAARDALAAIDPADELAQATALWQRRFGAPPADDREKARQLRFLLSRGYGPGIAFKVLRAAGARVDDEP